MIFFWQILDLNSGEQKYNGNLLTEREEMRGIRGLFLVALCLFGSQIVLARDSTDIVKTPKPNLQDRMLEFIYRILGRVVPHTDQKRADIPESSLNDPNFQSEAGNYLDENALHYMYLTYAQPALESFVYVPGQKRRRVVLPKTDKKSDRASKRSSKDSPQESDFNVLPEMESGPEDEELDQFRDHATSKLKEWIKYHQAILDQFPNKKLPSYVEW
jgi:hypothetical protein